MKKIKVLRIIARLNIGGPAIHAILLCQGLDKDKFDSLLVYGSLDKDEGDMLYFARDKGVRLQFVPELKRRLCLFADLKALKRIYRIIKDENPDIIHTHTAKAGTLGRLAGIAYNFLHPIRKRKIILIHTFHGHVFEGYFGKVKSRVFVLIERILAFFTRSILTVSESVKEELLSLRITRVDKIRVIPLGFELDKFLLLAPAHNRRLQIGIIGRLVPVKNHRLFLEAASAIIKDDPSRAVDFKIIGDGELRKDLEEYARKLGIADYVYFLGWQKDLARVYAELDIVALTSKNEGTPVSLIEAMAAARLIVATDVGGVRDLLGKDSALSQQPGFKVLERGILVRPNDAGSFTAALKFAMKDTRFGRDIRARARSFVEKQFTKARLVKDIEELYFEVLRD